MCNTTLRPIMFQSTRPHGARPGNLIQPLPTRRCFNPRARTGRDLSRPVKALFPRVSIHAPARGATSVVQSRPSSLAFQSTRPHGARRQRRMEEAGYHLVSIHAPARGATPVMALRIKLATSFNPRARTGRDRNRLFYFSLPVRFQSTRPHGARLYIDI